MIIAGHRRTPAAQTPATAGFTLVELMVVMVILAMLAALTLSGLSGVRDRVKADKTRSTIRKINEIVMPQYDSYLTRRVLLSGAGMTPMVCTSGTFVPGGAAFTLASGAFSAAVNRLWAQRLIMTLEMPDQWIDVGPGFPARVPAWTVTTPVRRYAKYKQQIAPSDAYQSAECLAMLVMRGGFDPDTIEAFRNDEVGDRDKDGAVEFWDGWGSPIAFIRWPSGYTPASSLVNPDPFDPMRVADPPNAEVSPLLYSPGPDESLNIESSASGYGLISSNGAIPNGWVNLITTEVSRGIVSLQQGTALAGSLPVDDSVAKEAARDNITNFDLMRK